MLQVLRRALRRRQLVAAVKFAARLPMTFRLSTLKPLDIFSSHIEIFSDFGNRPLGQTSVVVHRIHIGDASLVHWCPYRVSATEQSIIQQEVNKMLAKDIIEPSSNRWASPVVLVKKKDALCRSCVDYHHINTITKKDAYPLPQIDDALDCLYGATSLLSTLDLDIGRLRWTQWTEGKRLLSLLMGFTSSRSCLLICVMPQPRSSA